MNQDNMFLTMIASHSVASRRFMTIHSILSILIVIALSGSIWCVWLMTSMVSGVQTGASIKVPPQICLPSDAQERLRLITERPTDYLACLEKEMKP